MTFSEESSRIIHEMCNIELFELGQVYRNRPVPFMLEALAGGIDLLFLWRLFST